MKLCESYPGYILHIVIWSIMDYIDHLYQTTFTNFLSKREICFVLLGIVHIVVGVDNALNCCLKMEMVVY